MNEHATDKAKATMEVMAAIAEVIQAAGAIPSGHLYAALTSKLDLETYQVIIGTLVEAGLVKNKNHLLTWAGGRKAGAK